MPRASTSPGWKRATACSTAAAAPAAGSARAPASRPRPKAAERTPPPEPGGGAGWRHGRPPLGAGPGRRSPRESVFPAPSARPPGAAPAPACQAPRALVVWCKPSAHRNGPTLVRLRSPDGRRRSRIRTIPFRPAQPLAELDGHASRSPPCWMANHRPMAPGGPAFDSEQDRESLKLRTTLADAIASDTEFTAGPAAGSCPADAGRAQGADRRRLSASASATCRCSTRWRTASAACAAACAACWPDAIRK